MIPADAIKKLELIIAKRYKSFYEGRRSAKPERSNESWYNYLREYGIRTNYDVPLGKCDEWLEEHSKRTDIVVIEHMVFGSRWVAIPLVLAERVLFLGDLP